MDFFLKNSQLVVVSEKKEILLGDSVFLDSMELSMPGEYEKSQMTAHVKKCGEGYMYLFHIEGRRVGYISVLEWVTPEWALEIIGDLDVLVVPPTHALLSLIESVAPSIAITYFVEESPLGAAHASVFEGMKKYVLKEADMSADATKHIILTDEG